MSTNIIFAVLGVLIIVGLGAFTYTKQAAMPTPVDSNPVTSPASPSQTPPTASNTQCESDIKAYHASAGIACGQVIISYTCPSNKSFVYSARDTCEGSYLAGKGWIAADTGVQ